MTGLHHATHFDEATLSPNYKKALTAWCKRMGQNHRRATRSKPSDPTPEKIIFTALGLLTPNVELRGCRAFAAVPLERRVRPRPTARPQKRNEKYKSRTCRDGADHQVGRERGLESFIAQVVKSHQQVIRQDRNANNDGNTGRHCQLSPPAACLRTKVDRRACHKAYDRRCKCREWRETVHVGLTFKLRGCALLRSPSRMQG